MSIFDQRRILDALMRDITSPGQGETDKAFADTFLHGAGYLRFTAAGIEHVPYDHIRITEPST